MTLRRRIPLLLPIALVLALAGCGGATSSVATAPATSTEETTGPRTGSGDDGKTVVVALGDSITAGSPLWDPNPRVRAQIGPALNERSQFEYWATKADQSLEFRNCGVFGERTDEIAQRLDECAAGADALIIQGGINDIAQGRPVKDAADDIQSMVERGRDLGLPVAIIDVLPWNNGHPAADRPIGQLNDLIDSIGERQGVPVLPFHDTLEDPNQPGLMSEELTIDNDHPSVAGYQLLAEQALKDFDPRSGGAAATP